MEIRSRHLPVTRSARVVESGDAGNARSVWYLLHGYGQLAADFLVSCAALARPDRLLVAPEGLSRFYTRGMSEAPGASWMTREDRAAEIADQGRYLDALHADVLARLGGLPERIILLGFSQGATTADRWAASGTIDPDALVLWAGAPAMDLGAGTRRARRMVLVYGDKDPYITPKAALSLRSLLDSRGQRIETVTFDGAHEILDTILGELAERLDP